VNDDLIPFGDPWFVDAGDLLDRGDPGPTPMLVEGLIVDRSLVAVVGRWKTTKSYGFLDLCISVTTGRPAFGRFAIPEPGPVLFVNEESGEVALWRRLDALCRGRAITADDIRNRLFVSANKGVRLDDPDWQSRLVEFGLRVRPRLFVFDPLARMKSSARKENAQEEIAPLIEFMRSLRDETNAAVGFVHHSGHSGEHMRGSSDLESAWESRLQWKRNGQSSEVEVVAEHREQDAPTPFRYRIAWDGMTRSMRLEALDDPFVEFVRQYLVDHRDASGNEVYKSAEGRDDRPRRSDVLDLVRLLRESGSHDGNHPGTTPAEPKEGSGSPTPLFRGVGTTPTVATDEVVPEPGTALRPAPLGDGVLVDESACPSPPILGDLAFVEHIWTAHANGHVTDAEFEEALNAHELIRSARRRST
jgi:hypothetical protein